VVAEEGVFALPWLRAALADTLQRQRGHAVLVHGAPGDGAWDFAMALGQGWLCEATAGPGVSGARPCGRCGSCRLYRQFSHPDMAWLVPQEIGLQRGFPVQVDSGRKPSKQIRVDEVREVTEGMTSTSGRGAGRVLVIFPGEAMNAIAASALLKTLEEPPAGTRIVLASAEPARLLPTILSRCQRLQLVRPTTAQATPWLAEQGVEAPQVLLAACAGRPLDAWALHRGGMTAQAWSALPQRLARGDASALAGLGPAGVLDALAKLCHDAMCSAVGATPRFFVDSAFPQALQLNRLDTWHQSLKKLQRHADHPWNEPLLTDALVAEGVEALRSSLP
jgi:DNA polymerase III subunit delta'